LSYSFSFGALILDDCYSNLAVTGLLTDLYNGKTTLVDPRTGMVSLFSCAFKLSSLSLSSSSMLLLQGKARQGKARQIKANHFNVLNICYRKIFLWATTQVNKDKYESKND
jgi:hypothetical protein